jgi:glycosyltransferase involved in cell wall biosynthesis
VLRDVGIENCCVIPHGVNSQLFKRKERALHDGKLTLGVASKRYGHFVKGEKYWYEMLHSLDPGLFKFVLVGENRCQDEPILKKFGFDSVVFDNLPYVLYPSFYDEIDLLCVFSVAEGGPANIPEAIQCGVPILGRDVGMIPDAISEGNGILLPESPIEAGRLLNSLTQESKDVLNSLFKAASSIPLPLTWQEVVDGYVKVYRNVANKTTVIS